MSTIWRCSVSTRITHGNSQCTVIACDCIKRETYYLQLKALFWGPCIRFLFLQHQKQYMFYYDELNMLPVFMVVITWWMSWLKPLLLFFVIEQTTFMHSRIIYFICHKRVWYFSFLCVKGFLYALKNINI